MSHRNGLMSPNGGFFFVQTVDLNPPLYVPKVSTNPKATYEMRKFGLRKCSMSMDMKVVLILSSLWHPTQPVHKENLAGS